MASAKKVIPILLLGVGAAFAVRAFNTKQAMSRLALRGARIKKINLRGLSFDVEVEVTVQNPGSVSLPFEYYTGTVSHAGTELSNFTFNGQGKNMILAARSDTPVTFNLKIGSINLVAKIIQLIKDIKSGKPVDTLFVIRSTFYAAGIDIPVNFTHDIKPAALISGAHNIDGLKLKSFFKKANNVNPFFAADNFLKNRKKKKQQMQQHLSPSLSSYVANTAFNDEPAGMDGIAGIGAVNRGKTTAKKALSVYKEYLKNEENNAHSENVVLLAKHFGSATDLKNAKTIIAKHNSTGYLTNDVSSARYALSKKLYPKLIAAKNKLNAIGKPTARLEFDSNDQMAKHFGCADRPKIFFSKN